MNSPSEWSKAWHRLRIAAGWGVCALPIFALADEPRLPTAHITVAGADNALPTGQPGMPGNTIAPPPNQSSEMPQPGQRQRFGTGSAMPVTTQEWDKAQKWMEQNAPKRWAYLQSIQAGNPSEFRREFREFFVPRIRQIDWLHESDIKLYDLRMKRIKMEDDAFGLLQQVTSSKSVEEKSSLTASLKSTLGDMYDNTMDERQQRINELQTFLQSEQKKLHDDQQPDHREKHVENSLSRALATGTLDNLPHDNNPHQRGNGQQPTQPPSTQP